MTSPKRKCGQHFIINIGLYPFDVMVSIGETTEKVIKEIDRSAYKLTDEEIKAIEMHGRGRTVMLEGGGIVLRLARFNGDSNSLAVLAHEVFHAVYALFDRVGIKIVNESDEAFAYAIEHLMREILNRIKPKSTRRKR